MTRDLNDIPGRVTIPPPIRERILAEIAASLYHQPVSILHAGTPFPQLLSDRNYTEALRYIPDSVWTWYE